MSVSDFPVAKNPGWLLRFLGLSGPDAPDRLVAPIQGVVDLLPWWSASAEATGATQVTPGAGTIGFLIAATVPAGQRWLVSSLNCHNVGPVPAAHTYGYVCAYRFQSDVSTIVYALGPPIYPAVGEAGCLDGFNGNCRGAWLILGPGDTLGCQFLRNTGATPAGVVVAWRYTTFPA